MSVSEPEQIHSDYLSGWRLHVVIACLFWGSFVMALDTNIINVALPVITAEFHDLEGYAWYGSAYLLTLTAFQPIYGSLFKYFQTDVVYRTAIFSFEVGSVLCAAAVSPVMFIIGRAVAGFGAAGILQGALSIISQVVALEKRSLYMGVVISVFAITTTVGPVLGGVFTQHSTWRWCFWVNLPIGALVLIGLTLFLKVEGTRNDDRALPLRIKIQRMDLVGCLTFLGAICCLLLAFQWGGQSKAWDSADVVGCLVGAVAIGTLFLWLSWRGRDTALIPLRILKKRSIWTGSMVLFCFGAQNCINSYYLPLWFQGVKGFDPITTGVDFIPRLLPQLVALVLAGAMVKRFGQYVPYMLIGELIAIGGQVMLTQIRADSSTLYWAASLVVSGIGTGIAMQLPYTAVAVTLSDKDIPVGNAVAVLFYQLGGALFISVGQNITISTIIDLVPKALPHLSSSRVIDGDATNLEAIATDAADLEVLRGIWNTAITRTMILSAAIVGVSIPFTLGMEWLNAVKVAKDRAKASEFLEQEENGSPKTSKVVTKEEL